jgi:hypothetical protein
VKLKFERFEGIACFSVRGKIELSQLRILAIGLETMIKGLEEPLVVNLSLASFEPQYLKTLLDLKKILGKNSRHKIYWVGKAKGLTDFLNLGLLFSRLGGFRLRQVGEYLVAQDEIYQLTTQSEALKVELERLGGDGDQAQKIILENTSLKVQNRILARTLSILEERMKEQTKNDPSDPEHEQKVAQALADLKAAYGEEIRL